MKLSYEGLKDREGYKARGVVLPAFDWQEMHDETMKNPVWVHFGAGNIFRGFIAALQQRLLNTGDCKSGIIAAETFDMDIIDKIYTPHDAMTLMVALKPDGSTEKEVIASIARGVKADCRAEKDWQLLRSMFENPSLQMVSFTITEKGYALKNMEGNYLGVVAADMEKGPESPVHAMAVVASMLYSRFQAGAYPIAMVSMDNCSHNGARLRAAVMDMASAWVEKGLADKAFLDYVGDEKKVSFPWSMIDKITPRPAPVIFEGLTEQGFEDMDVVVTGRNTYIAPFVNAEIPQYLVVEDRFPNGRPALEKAGVYLCSQETVNMTERMKVTTCLNPLHTALAVYGCLLGYESIAAEMQDEDLVKLVKTIGYQEGLPVVTDPGIISPRAFIDEVVTQRLPNPFIPDTPQRIATDTSQKVGIRFGETIKSYMAAKELDAASLTAIPLALAGWLRYVLAVDDNGNAMTCSPDPMLATMQEQLASVKLGAPETATDEVLKPILSNATLFGVDLYEVGLAGKVQSLLQEMLAGPGAVRAALKAHV